MATRIFMTSETMGTIEVMEAPDGMSFATLETGVFSAQEGLDHDTITNLPMLGIEARGGTIISSGRFLNFDIPRSLDIDPSGIDSRRSTMTEASLQIPDFFSNGKANNSPYDATKKRSDSLDSLADSEDMYSELLDNIRREVDIKLTSVKQAQGSSDNNDEDKVFNRRNSQSFQPNLRNKQAQHQNLCEKLDLEFR